MYQCSKGIIDSEILCMIVERTMVVWSSSEGNRFIVKLKWKFFFLFFLWAKTFVRATFYCTYVVR